MRVGFFVAAAFGAAGVLAAAACTTFTAEDDPGDGGADSSDATIAPASDATIAPACVLPSVAPKTGDDSAACVCMAPTTFKGTILDDAVVSKGTIFARNHAAQILSGPINVVTAPALFANDNFAGASLGMFVADKVVYLATTAGVHSYDLRAPTETTTMLPVAPDTALDNVLFGTSTIYTWGATHIAKREIADGGVSADRAGVKISAAAIDGDEAYFTVAGGSIASVSNPSPQGTFPEPINAIAVGKGFAFAATQTSTTLISRVTLSGPNAASIPLITEFGLVQRMAVDGERLYWISRRGGDGGVVLASSDLCGGDYHLLGTKLPDATAGLSFDDTYVYIAGNGEELRKVAKK